MVKSMLLGIVVLLFCSHSARTLRFVFSLQWIVGPLSSEPGQVKVLKLTFHSSTETPPSQDVPKVFTEGGMLVNVSSSAPPPVAIHASVKKRILSATPDSSEPAPVKEDVTNTTTAKSVLSVSLDKPLSVANITSTAAAPVAGVNSTSSGAAEVTTNNSTVISQEKPPGNGMVIVSSTVSSSTTSTTTTTTTSTKAPTTSTTTSTTTTTTTTTTTPKPKPKKPTITVSLDDDPGIVHVPSKTSSGVSQFHNNLDVEEPIAQFSRESAYDENVRLRNSHRDLVIPVVSLIFTIPMLLGLATVLFRKFRDYWHTRHYRRMDFLVDGIYND